MSVLPAGFGSGAGAAPSYTIGNSVRMRGFVNASLSRTFGSGGSLTTWTWAAWVKRGALSTDQQLFCRNPASNYQTCAFYAAAAPVDSINLQLYTSPTPIANLFSNALFTDSSAWYHIVIVWDSTNLTAGDRWRLYVNGVREALTGTYPPLNAVSYLNDAGVHTIGALNSGIGQNFDGYLAHNHFIDGQTLNPSDFGQFDSNGVWTPKDYAGTYGTTGYYLEFDDGSNVTNLCLDRSGNGNNWTSANISVSPGATYDWMTDTPTDNYAVLANRPAVSGYDFRNANLTSAGTNARGLSTMSVSTGKYYWEVLINANGSQDLEFGIVPDTQGVYVNINNASGAYGWGTKLGQRWDNGVLTATGIGTAAPGDIASFTLDLNAYTFTVFKNGVQLYQTTSIQQLRYYPAGNAAGVPGTDNFTFNFGQRPFTYTPPTGFVALRTSNLPSAPIANGGDNFDAKTYTGTAATQNITGLEFQPDFVWMKSRGRALDHALYDSVRGVQLQLESNTNSTETTETTGLTAFNSDGWTMGALDQINSTTATNSYVGWAWKANGAAVTNTAGSISSQVSANTAAGISVITYTGTGANATVGHGLGVAPSFLVVRRRDSVGFSWITWHSALAGTEYLILENTNAVAAFAGIWNSTVPSSTVFSLGTNTNPNSPGGTYIAYCFAPIPGFSKFGTYTGNAAVTGAYVFCGFRPRYVMIKCITSNQSGNAQWVVKDTARSPYNPAFANLYSNLLNAEDTTASAAINITAGGFTVTGNYVGIYDSSNTYIYIAFAENPFGGSNVSPANAR